MTTTTSITCLDDLKSKPQWVCYLQDKTPINPRTTGNAKSNIPATWASYDVACKLWASDKEKYAGIGFELIKAQRLIVIDLDHCIENGVIAQWALDIVNRINSYAETSPSGTGIHIWLIGEIDTDIGNDTKSNLKIEIYSHDRYLTITGKQVDGTPDTFQERQEEITLLHSQVTEARRIEKEKNRQREKVQAPRQDAQSGDSRYGLKALEDECADLASTLEGGRNSRLNQAAFAMGQLVSGNELTQATAEQALYAAATSIGLGDAEIEKTMRSGMESGMRSPRKAPEKEVPAAGSNITPGTPITSKMLCDFSADDAGNGDAMYALFGNKFAYNGSLGWLYYTGTHWEQDESSAALMKAAIETLRTRRHAAVDADMEKVIKATVSDAKRINGAIACFRPHVVASVETFDSQEHLLNCKNGVVNLKTGKITPHDASQRFTYCVQVDYKESDFIEWKEYLQGVVGGGQEMIDYLQLALGYSLTGSTREECLFYIYGPSRSGKGTVAEIIMRLLPRPLSTMVDFNSFTAKREGDVSNFDLAELKPSRVVFASESQRNQSLNPAKIKQLTGGDLVRACFKHKQFFAYRPQFKVWMLSNWPVNGDPEDDALWGRVRVIPFPNSYLGKEDKGKKERLKSDEVLTSILYWAVQGAMKWYRLGSTGLKTPEHVVKVTQEQRSALDFVGQWLEACSTIDKDNEDLWTSNEEIMKSYTSWCELNSVSPKKARSLAQSLQIKGLKTGVQKKIDGINAKGVIGITIRKKEAAHYKSSLFEQEEKVTVTDGNGSNGELTKNEYVRVKSQNHPLPSVTVTNPLPDENEEKLSDIFPDQPEDQKEQARQFLKQFCSQPGCGLQLEGNKIMISLPSTLPPEEKEHYYTQVLERGEMLRQILRESA